MTDATGGGQATFRVGAVLSRGMGLYFRHIVSFLVIGIVTYLPLIAFTIAFGDRYEEVDPASPSGMPGGGVIAAILVTLVGFMCWCAMSAGVTYGVISSMRQGGFRVGIALNAALRAILPLLGLSLIGAALGAVGGVVLGLLSLIADGGPIIGIIGLAVVGCYLLVRWWLSVPAVVVEGLGPLAALRRSTELTAGYRWRVFFVVLLWLLAAVVVMVVATLIIAAIFGADGAEPSAAGSLPLEIAGTLLELVLGGIGSAVVAVGYHDLRIAREGIGTDDIARVFD